MFSDNYVRLCKEKGVGITVASQEIGCSANAGKKWSEGSIPRKTTLLKLAEYFGVSVDDLMDGQPTAMSYGNTPLIDAKKAITNTDDGLNEKYAKYDVLIDLFDSLPPDRQNAVIRQLQEIVRLQKAQDDLLKF